jgi:hypothetical protein
LEHFLGIVWELFGTLSGNCLGIVFEIIYLIIIILNVFLCKNLEHFLGIVWELFGTLSGNCLGTFKVFFLVLWVVLWVWSCVVGCVGG